MRYLRAYKSVRPTFSEKLRAFWAGKSTIKEITVLCDSFKSACMERNIAIDELETKFRPTLLSRTSFWIGDVRFSFVSLPDELRGRNCFLMWASNFNFFRTSQFFADEIRMHEFI